jgi:hypothetical protein
MLVLQSCTDPLQVLPGSASESLPTSSAGACNFNNIDVEENIDVKEEGFTVINKVSYIDIKQEEFPEDTVFPDIKAEPDEVRCVCMSVIRRILPVSRNVYTRRVGLCVIAKEMKIVLSACS